MVSTTTKLLRLRKRPLQDALVLNPAFSSVSRNGRPALQPLPSSSRRAMSWSGFAHFRARSHHTFRNFILPHSIQPRPRLVFRRSRRCIQRCMRFAFFRAIPPGRNALFSRIVIALSGGTSCQSAAARTGRVRVLLERNPPNRPSSRPAPPPYDERAIPLAKPALHLVLTVLDGGIPPGRPI